MLGMLDPHSKIASVLINKNLGTNGPEKEPGVHEDAAELEIVKEIMDAFKSNKPEKANRALMMLIKMCYDNYEEQEASESDETPES